MGVQEKFDYMVGLVTGSNDPVLLKSVMEVQRELISIQEENRELRNEIHELKNEKILEGDLEYHQGVYTKGNDTYCAVCWDRDKRLSRVRSVKMDENGATAFICDVCNKWRFSDLPYKK